MSNATIELHEYTPEGNVNIVLRKQIDIEGDIFPDVVIWKDETYALEDFQPGVHAIFVKTSHIKITYAPVIP